MDLVVATDHPGRACLQRAWVVSTVYLSQRLARLLLDGQVVHASPPRLAGIRRALRRLAEQRNAELVSVRRGQ